MTFSLEPEFTTLGDEVWSALQTIMEEGFSDLDGEGEEEIPPWPLWLFGNTPEQEARGEHVTEDMVPPAYKAVLEASAGMTADMAAILGFGADWYSVMDVALTYAIRVALHVQLKDVEGIFLDEDYIRASLIAAINEAVDDSLREEDDQ